MKLYKYQETGVKWLNAKHRSLLADDMGIGKSAQVITHLKECPERLPALIVVPASLKINWQREVEMWFGIESQIVSGNKPVEFKSKIVIINYDVLAAHAKNLVKANFETLVCDEAHYVKNKKAIRTKAVVFLQKTIPFFIAVTGTPIENRPFEMYNILKIISPAQFKNFWHYVQHFCNAKHNGYGWDYTGHSNTEELYNLINNKIMLRRKKEDVLKDLPEKTRSVLMFPLENKAEYYAYQNEFYSGEISPLVGIQHLKRLAGQGKLKSIDEWIQNIIDNGNKVVVFAIHHIIIDNIFEKFKKIAVKLDGRSTSEQRQKAVDDFQGNEKIKLFVGQIKAAGVGITLTAATHCLFAELDWSPFMHFQAEDRLHRIGQKNNVTCYYAIAEKTIEEKIMTMLQSKKEVIDKTIDGKTIDSEDDSIFSTLLKEYSKNPDS